METRQQKIDDMSIGFISYEFPPNVFGGVGVHVSELTRHLAKSIGQMHVFTSYVEGLSDQKVDSVYVHRSHKPLVPESNRSSNTYKGITLNFNISGMMDRYSSSEKTGRVYSHGGLKQMVAMNTKKAPHLPLLMTTRNIASGKFDSDKLIGVSVMEQDMASVAGSHITVS